MAGVVDSVKHIRHNRLTLTDGGVVMDWKGKLDAVYAKRDERIRKRRAQGRSLREIGREFDLSHEHVRQICGVSEGEATTEAMKGLYGGAA